MRLKYLTTCLLTIVAFSQFGWTQDRQKELVLTSNNNSELSWKMKASSNFKGTGELVTQMAGKFNVNTQFHLISLIGIRRM